MLYLSSNLANWSRTHLPMLLLKCIDHVCGSTIRICVTAKSPCAANRVHHGCIAHEVVKAEFMILVVINYALYIIK